MSDRELLGSRGITVLVYGAALILPSLFVWAGFGFVAWNWNPGEWTQQSRAATAFLALLLTSPAVGFARGVV